MVTEIFINYIYRLGKLLTRTADKYKKLSVLHLLNESVELQKSYLDGHILNILDQPEKNKKSFIT